MLPLSEELSELRGAMDNGEWISLKIGENGKGQHGKEWCHSLGLHGRVDVCRRAVYWSTGDCRTQKGWSISSRSTEERGSFLLTISIPLGGLRCVGANGMICGKAVVVQCQWARGGTTGAYAPHCIGFDKLART